MAVHAGGRGSLSEKLDRGPDALPFMALQCDKRFRHTSFGTTLPVELKPKAVS
jgi:hypothetical protein